MVARLTTTIFVAALIRRVQAGGGFAYVARHGNDEAGTLFVAFHRAEDGRYDLFQPAPPDLSGARDTVAQAHMFVPGPSVSDALALRDFAEREARFDPDFWLVEIENWTEPVDALIALAS
ncbi:MULTISPECIES: DUF1491 family protein [unclassified Roseitalea]|uniref:DUF1491 family protein n=1 Tax=unclassified Roseitalea TaxID=2639107 RepID=UPI00273EC93D|nr:MULTISPECIES: DUF1491 family protein [unclassified Roseitalea]